MNRLDACEKRYANLKGFWLDAKAENERQAALIAQLLEACGTVYDEYKNKMSIPSWFHQLEAAIHAAEEYKR